MATIIRKSIEGYNFLFHDLPDPRTKNWFLVAKPFHVTTVVGLYLLFIFKWGPRFMQNRKPFNLDRIMIVYNLIQIISCAYIFYHGVIVWSTQYKICEPVDISTTEEAISVARKVYIYYILKVLDLADTIFFVLRKKDKQISFLHVYHHTGMVMTVWGAVTYLPGGHATLIGVVNSFVHVVMYSYYLLTIAKPSIRNSIAIKKFVTQIQIVQFFLLTLHMGSIVFIPTCSYPRWTAAFFLPQNLFMLLLFIDFYIKNYVRKPKQLANSKKIDEANGGYANGDTAKKIEYIEHFPEDKPVVDTNVILRNGYNKSMYGVENLLSF